MPRYTYTCQDCASTFEARLAYDEVDTAHPACPNCASDSCERVFSKATMAVGASGAEDGFRLTREHVEAAAGMSNLMQGGSHDHGHSHGGGGCACGGACSCGGH